MDAYSQWERHDAEQERKLAELPLCTYCEEHIQDEYYYEINDENICPDCMESYFRKEN